MSPPPETNYSVPNFLPGSPVLAAPQLDGDDDGLDDYDDENGEDGGKVKGRSRRELPARVSATPFVQLFCLCTPSRSRQTACFPLVLFTSWDPIPLLFLCPRRFLGGDNIEGMAPFR